MEERNIKIIDSFYERLEKLKEANIIANVYGGFDEDVEVLTDFLEFLCKYFKEKMPNWVNAYIQLYSWEFQRYHEGLDTYYENLYGNTDSKSIQKAVEYLQHEGYKEIAVQLIAGLSDNKLIANVEKWIDENQECIYDCYIDLLINHKNELLES